MRVKLYSTDKQEDIKSDGEDRVKTECDELIVGTKRLRFILAKIVNQKHRGTQQSDDN